MALTDSQIRNALPADSRYRLTDGEHGLYLCVHPHGGKYFVFRFTWRGKDAELALGTYPKKTLKQARTDPSSGALRIVSGLSFARILLVANSYVALQLQQAGHLIPGDDTILIHSLEIPMTLPRSPRGAPGRTGKIGTRQISVRKLLAGVVNSDELISQFRLEVTV
jgi:hypothetical protein